MDLKQEAVLAVNGLVGKKPNNIFLRTPAYINSDVLFYKWRFSAFRPKIFPLSLIIFDFGERGGGAMTRTRASKPKCKQNRPEAHKSLVLRKNKNELVPK